MSSLTRTCFQTSRTLDFLSKKELIAQTGHQVAEWPLVVLKELLDNALDACEEAGIAPAIAVTVDDTTISVSDNGPGIPESLLDSVLDFSIRVSSREAYVSPCRGAQGNALKTIVAMPFALCGAGSVIVEAHGTRHEITVTVDRLRQEPKISHSKGESEVVAGTRLTVEWPDKASSFPKNRNSHFLQNGENGHDKASSILANAKARFLQIADDYTWVNPHLTLTVQWGEDHLDIPASMPAWKKWLPSFPTDPHWYGVDELERLIAANVCHDAKLGRSQTVREFVSEFHGLSGTAKQKRVLAAVGQSRVHLADLVVDGAIDKAIVNKLLEAMKAEAKPVKPPSLGVIGKEHLLARAELAGGDPDSFNYKKIIGTDRGLPWVIETAFAYCPKEERGRRIITGVNWSPGIVNPFRQLGRWGQSLDSVLEQQRCGCDEPTVLVLHICCPRISYADRGKSSVIVED